MRLLVFLSIASATLLPSGVCMSAPSALAQSACAGLFAPTRAKLPRPASFMPMDEVLEGKASRMAVLLELHRLLPAGTYDVIVNGTEPSRLSVSYSPSGAMTLRLGFRQLAQTESVPLVVSELEQNRGSVMGLDADIALFKGAISILNSVYNGREETYPGVQRRDTVVHITEKPDGSAISIRVQDGLSTKSLYGMPIAPSPIETKIEFRNFPPRHDPQ